ncbi:hypothetical protein ACJX0J_020003, partial [Zea mays]
LVLELYYSHNIAQTFSVIFTNLQDGLMTSSLDCMKIQHFLVTLHVASYESTSNYGGNVYLWLPINTPCQEEVLVFIVVRDVSFIYIWCCGYATFGEGAHLRITCDNLVNFCVYHHLNPSLLVLWLHAKRHIRRMKVDRTNLTFMVSKTNVNNECPPLLYVFLPFLRYWQQ